LKLATWRFTTVLFCDSSPVIGCTLHVIKNWVQVKVLYFWADCLLAGVGVAVRRVLIPAGQIRGPYTANLTLTAVDVAA
jgi:hypothetical protein